MQEVKDDEEKEKKGNTKERIKKMKAGETRRINRETKDRNGGDCRR